MITSPPEDYTERRAVLVKKLLMDLKMAGIYVKETTDMHEHFAVFDKEIIWYGSMNLLSGEKADDSMMRVESKEIADELLEIGFTRRISS